MHQARSTDDIVQAHPRSSPFHLLAWKRTIEESFRYRPCYLVARGGGVIRAVLPLFLVRNPLLGKALISSPFAVYGGILADSAGARDALYGYVKGLGGELDVVYSEFPSQPFDVAIERVSRARRVGQYAPVYREWRGDQCFSQQRIPDQKQRKYSPNHTAAPRHQIAGSIPERLFDCPFPSEQMERAAAGMGLHNVVRTPRLMHVGCQFQTVKDDAYTLL